MINKTGFWSAVLSAAVSGTFATAAQEATESEAVEADESAAESISEETTDLGEFVATGSLLPTETASRSLAVPIQVIKREEFEEAGFATAEEFLQNLPINNGGSVPMQNNQTGFTPGASSVSLRGQGPNSTLVLLNGRRLAAWPTGAGGTGAFVDLNSIPAASIERIEVLKDGASAFYGADAVAGVVNIITRSDFEGTELLIRYGNDTSGTDSSEYYNSLTFGFNDQRGNLSGNLFYLKKNSIFQSNRHFSAIPPFLSSNAIPMNIQISAAAAREALQLSPDALITGVDIEGVPSPQDRLIRATSGPSNPDGTRTPAAVIAENDGTLAADQYTYLPGWGSHSRYNFNGLAQATPEIERLGSSLSFRRKIFSLDHLTAYGDVSYARNEMVSSLAPTATGNFRDLSGVSIVVPANTPQPISVPQSNMEGVAAPGYVRYPGPDAMPNTGDDFFRLGEVAAGAFNPHNPFNQDLEGSSRIRLEEFGLRIQEILTDAYTTTWGIRADDLNLGSTTWNLDGGFRFSRVEQLNTSRLVSKSRLNRLMNAADPWFDPGSDQYVGTTIPYNPFGASQFDGYLNENNRSIAQHAIINPKYSADSDLWMNYVNASSSNIYELPGGHIGFAFGYDWRRESIQQYPDPLSRTGDVASYPVQTSTNADRAIQGAFFETYVPVIGPDMKTAIHSFDLNISGRYEDFIDSDRSTFVPKFSTRLAPIRQVAMRGSWGQGFREPSLFELFSGRTHGLATISNPWNPEDRNPEIDISTGGNPHLEPEDSTAYNVGIVYSPDFLRGFTVSLDYWQLERSGSIANNPQDTVDRIFQGGTVYPGETVIRDAQDNILRVDTVFQNTAFSQTTGIDIASSYVRPTPNYGTFSWVFNFTWLIEALGQDNPNRPIFDYVGYGTGTGFELREPQGVDLEIGTQDGKPLVITTVGMNNDAYLEYKFTSAFGWSYREFDINLIGRYTDSFIDIDENLQLSKVDSRLLWDMQLAYRFFTGRSHWMANTTVTFGVENVFDIDPPRAFAFYNNPQGYPGFLYEPDGQRYYLSLKKTF